VVDVHVIVHVHIHVIVHVVRSLCIGSIGRRIHSRIRVGGDAGGRPDARRVRRRETEIGRVCRLRVIRKVRGHVNVVHGRGRPRLESSCD